MFPEATDSPALLNVAGEPAPSQLLRGLIRGFGSAPFLVPENVSASVGHQLNRDGRGVGVVAPEERQVAEEAGVAGFGHERRRVGIEVTRDDEVEQPGEQVGAGRKNFFAARTVRVVARAFEVSIAGIRLDNVGEDEDVIDRIEEIALDFRVFEAEVISAERLISRARGEAAGRLTTRTAPSMAIR